MSFAPTFQQTAIVKACIDYSEVKVEACAGSGKTSTLVLIAKALEVPSLYLAFNKVTANEAAEKFPRHVKCQTTHSAAYAVFGNALREKLSRPKGGYVNVAGTGSEIARYYKISSELVQGDITISANFIGLLVRQTVALFEQSADETVQLKHVPTHDLALKLHDSKVDIQYIKKIVLKWAERLWKDRTSTKTVVLATHDTYLKMFQLSKPVFQGVEALYVDEFQDTTPCVLDIIKNQFGKMKVVMVGDARQAIYGWRGAVNAMKMIDCESRSLTKSFRYGQSVADIATIVLERDMVITGNEAISSLAGLYNVVDRTQPHTRLFRTNSALLGAAISAIRAGTDISIEIDVNDFVKLLESAVALHRGDMKQVKHDKLLAYTEWEEMLEESKHDAELGRIAKVVKEGQAHQWIDLLKFHRNSEEPHITFTTAHKSKGREWSQVVVENDFKSCYNEDGEWAGLATEEQNLLYVACTRAIDRLEYNLTVREYLNKELEDEPTLEEKNFADYQRDAIYA